jgi:polyisoprenoid-binding protein YceI
MIEDSSTLGFTFRQMGSPITATFESFTTEITFDPTDLARARSRPRS